VQSANPNPNHMVQSANPNTIQSTNDKHCAHDDDHPNNDPFSQKTRNSSTATRIKPIKRQRCYECGTYGHHGCYCNAAQIVRSLLE
jgi:hypothetical protein